MTAGAPPQAGLEITSPANARVKRLVALRHRRARDRAGVTLVEGYEELGLALSAGARPQELYVCPALAGPGAQQMIDRVSGLGAEVIRVSRPVFGKIAYRESPDGWLAVLPAVRTSLAAVETGTSPLVLICEGVEKPGNLGAILRTADAAGITAVIAADPVTDWANPNVVRASKGTVFSVPVASASTAEVFAWLEEHSLALVAAAPDGDVPLTAADLTGPTAIAVGSEARGLPAAWLERAGTRLRIPMFGRADSLNVSTSAAILLYEAVRQRTARQSPVARDAVWYLDRQPVRAGPARAGLASLAPQPAARAAGAFPLPHARPPQWRQGRRRLLARWQFGQQFPGRLGHQRDRPLERLLRPRGRRLHPADLPHVLPRGRLDLLAGSRRLQPPQRRNVPAHVPDVTRRP